ncbi:MAG TPA: hypothetical protein VHZ73_14190, partial [Vicinamibacterales bacterium]|nr:hypothetical protein [Vicinamibacterales bacterium]
MSTLTRGNVLLFAGAGASTAVNRDQYPTTVEFFKRLPAEITAQPVFTMLGQFLNEKQPDGVHDIEKVLWALDELQRFVDEGRDTRRIGGWFLRSARLGRTYGQNVSLDNTVEAIEKANPRIQQLKDAINVQVHNFYA